MLRSTALSSSSLNMEDELMSFASSSSSSCLLWRSGVGQRLVYFAVVLFNANTINISQSRHDVFAPRVRPTNDAAWSADDADDWSDRYITPARIVLRISMRTTAAAVFAFAVAKMRCLQHRATAKPASNCGCVRRSHTDQRWHALIIIGQGIWKPFFANTRCSTTAAFVRLCVVCSHNWWSVCREIYTTDRYRRSVSTQVSKRIKASTKSTTVYIVEWRPLVEPSFANFIGQAERASRASTYSLGLHTMKRNNVYTYTQQYIASNDPSIYRFKYILLYFLRVNLTPRKYT